MILINKLNNIVKYRKRLGKYICNCGKLFITRVDSVNSGNTKSCGCARKDHGESRLTTEYARWESMNQRCSNPNKKNYRNYGGRGINVCKRWKNSYKNFLKDLDRCPKGYTLDRIDNDGNYTPTNCRWTSWKIQANNKGRS